MSKLHGEDCGGAHLFVQKLNDPLQFRRHPVSTKQYADTPSPKICLYLLPERLDILIPVQEVRNHTVGVQFAAGHLIEARPQDVHGSVTNTVSRIVEHLPYDLAADTGVAAPFHLDDRGHGDLVHKEVIQAETIVA